MIKMQDLLNQEDAKVYPFKNQPLATGKQLRLFVFDTEAEFVPPGSVDG